MGKVRAECSGVDDYGTQCCGLVHGVSVVTRTENFKNGLWPCIGGQDKVTAAQTANFAQTLRGSDVGGWRETGEVPLRGLAIRGGVYLVSSIRRRRKSSSFAGSDTERKFIVKLSPGAPPAKVATHWDGETWVKLTSARSAEPIKI